MEYKLYKNDLTKSKNLIVFFNGWAMNPASIEHLGLPIGYDLIVLWDYRTENNTPIEIINSYKYLYITAWSMGVWVANKIVPKHISSNIMEAVAICGTGIPISDEYGIPTDIFIATLNGINEENRDRFNRRMCGGKSLKHLFDSLKSRSTKEIRDELQIIYDRNIEDQCSITELVQNNFWTLALIGDRDKIIPADNQKRYWECLDVKTVIKTYSQHYLFQDIVNWNDLWTKYI